MHTTTVQLIIGRRRNAIPTWRSWRSTILDHFIARKQTLVPGPTLRSPGIRHYLRILRLLLFAPFVSTSDPYLSILPICSLSSSTPLASASACASDQELGRAIDAELTAPELQAGFQGIVIQSLDEDHTILYERNGDHVFVPASNNKLLTSAAALELLGPGFTYHTRLYRTGALSDDGTLNGDLFLRGSGDPLLSPEDLQALARQVYDAGVRRITGSLHYDDTLFDRRWLGDDWAWDDEPYYYSAQISALNVNENVITVHVEPGRKTGRPVSISLLPASRCTVVRNSAVTVPALAKASLTIERARGQNVIVVRGGLPVDTPVPHSPTVSLTVENPPRYTAELMLEILRRAGVRLDRGKILDGPTVPDQAVIAAEHVSLPLSKILQRQNKPSDNLVAECLLKTVGADARGVGTGGANGTGAEASRGLFARIGLDMTRLQQVDGSGLSRKDYVSPRNLVRLLAYMHTRPTFQALYDSLPIAGVDGTLARRMRGTSAANNCHAKTGTLSSVSSLSGYVTTLGGEMVAFSILMNNHLASSSVCAAVQDKIVTLLANYTRVGRAQ